jgi:thymidylate synthase ThyX
LGGIRKQLEKIAQEGPEAFLEEYYIGFGHKSIGDCGSAAVAIEGVSMLAAKAIQHQALYSGQESSTRYIDFSHQQFLDPLESTFSARLLENLREFYLGIQTEVQNHLFSLYPKNPEENGKEYRKAIRARAFDITRGFLPAGATTNLSWHTNLRQFADHLLTLRHHPLEEVRYIARAIESALREAYPNSFNQKRYAEREAYTDHWMNELYLYERETLEEETRLVRNNIDPRELARYREFLQKRPVKTELPKFLDELGIMSFGFGLDFGSSRDIQRHRPVTQRMPLVTDRHGFDSWYLDSLPTQVRTRAESLLAGHHAALDDLNVPKRIRQYYVPMGYKLPHRLSGGLTALIYLMELRSTRFVHPTLVKRIQEMAAITLQEFGEAGLVLHLDPEPGRFDVRRGQHDIIIR